MTDRKHAIEVGEMFDGMAARIAHLEAREKTLEQALAHEVGKNEQLEAINAKQHATICNRETALSIYQLGDKIAALEPLPRPAPPQITAQGPTVGQISAQKITPDQLEAMIEAEREPMPAFIRNAKQVSDRRPQRIA